MSYIITIDSEARVGLASFHGHVTGTDLLEACHDLVGHPDWRPGFEELWDLLHAEVDVTPREVDNLVASAHQLRDRISASQVAFVTTREAVGALVRLFELFTIDLGRTYKTFPTREAAAAWLGVPLDAVRA